MIKFEISIVAQIRVEDKQAKITNQTWPRNVRLDKIIAVKIWSTSYITRIELGHFHLHVVHCFATFFGLHRILNFMQGINTLFKPSLIQILWFDWNDIYDVTLNGLLISKIRIFITHPGWVTLVSLAKIMPRSKLPHRKCYRKCSNFKILVLRDRPKLPA